MSVFQGYQQGSNQAYLEQERERKLQGLDLQNNQSKLQNEAISQQNNARALKNDRVKEEQNYQDDERLRKIKAIESQQAKLNIDTALTDYFKGDVTKLKQTLMNSTDGNLNNDVKSMLEGELGGVITDVRTPDKQHLQEGEQYNPDQVEIEYLDPSGEKAVKHLSLNTLGGIMGTPTRVGTKTWAELVSGQHKKQQVLDAKRNAVNFDGSVSGYQQELLTLAVDGNDEARKVLDGISGLTAKDGESLMSALTKQYMAESDPKEKSRILDNMKSLRSLMNKTAKPTTVKPLEKAQQAVLDASTPEELKLAQEKLGILQASKGKLTALDNLKQKNAYQARQQVEAQDNLYKVVNIDNIVKGSATPEAIESAVQGIANAYKTSDERVGAVKRISQKVERDARTKGYLDLKDPATRTGRLSNHGIEVMKTLKNLESYQSKMLGSSTTKEQKKVTDATIMTLRTANDAVESYDKLKSLGLFKGVQSTGVANWVQKSVQDLLGDLATGDKDKANKALVHFKGQSDILDEIHKLDSKEGKLTYKEKAKRASLVKVVGGDYFRQMQTDTYLTLKKMLQAISGMGVTDKELQSYKDMFAGKDGTSMTSLMENLSNSAFSQNRLGNDAANGMINNGLGYSGRTAILNARRAGEYLINTRWKDKDITQGLNQQIGRQIALKVEHPKIYNQLVEAGNTHLGLNAGKVNEIVSTAQDHMDKYGTMDNFWEKHPNLNSVDRGKYVKLLKLYDELEKTSSKELNSTQGK